MELMGCVLMAEVSDLSVDQIVMYNLVINACMISVTVTVSIVVGYYGGRVEHKAGLQRSYSTRMNDDTIAPSYYYTTIIIPWSPISHCSGGCSAITHSWKESTRDIIAG
ncbi:hypothetical protein BJV82DRAFT_668984 [Fennellomyces sp. T-0311]|nr:hypothetical protein BJV82DRAFT_668984 [Fennellomyces sp. T-0311]